MLLAELTITEITDKLLLNEVYELRAKVWSELGVSLNNFPENKWMSMTIIQLILQLFVTIRLLLLQECVFTTK